MARKLAIVAGVVVAVLVVFGLVVRRLVDPEVVRAAIEQQASAALGQPVKVGAVDRALSARPRVVLSNVQIGASAAITLNRVEVSTGLRALLSKRVERGGLVISGSRITLPLPFALGGTTATSSTPTSDAAAGLTFASIDRISLSDIDMAVGNTHPRAAVRRQGPRRRAVMASRFSPPRAIDDRPVAGKQLATDACGGETQSLPAIVLAQ